MRQEGVDLAGRGGIQARQDVFEPEAEIDVVGFAGFGERKEDGEVLTAGFAGGEQPVFPRNGDSLHNSNYKSN